MEEVYRVRRAGPARYGWYGALLASVLLAGCAHASSPQAVPPAPPPPPQATPGAERQLLVAVDDLGSGFNPHLLADLSPVTTAVASLVLPSAFRPGPDGAPAPDTTVTSSAKVVSTAPFTVSYELALGASWSDNTPIAAEDFVYLWERMRREPGVVDAAGYRLITDVRSRAGGKVVDVVFAQRYPQWQRLFTNLLPAHLLKDAPRGWSTALADSVPVSGGPFVVSVVDRARGQLVLARNDHYWATPAVLDSLVLRRSDATGMLGGLRSGELPVVLAWPDARGFAALRELEPASAGPVARLQAVPEPMVVQLAMRTDQGVLSDERMRQAVGAMLDRDALIAVGTGNGAGGVRADAQLLAPSLPGYRPTAPSGAPTHPDPALVERLLTSAGYLRDPAGQWTSPGGRLRVTVGAPAERARFQAVAEEVGRQLVVAGVDARVITAPGSALFTDPTVLPAPPSTSASVSPTPLAMPAPGPPAALAPAVPPTATSPAAAPPAVTPLAATPPPATPAPSTEPSDTASAPPAGVQVDLEVMPRGIGGDLASEAASGYGCPPGMGGVTRPARNSTGLCSVELQPLLDAALDNGMTPEQAAGTLEPTLWRELPAIPLFQVVTTLASTPKGDRATGGIGPGPLLVGPFGPAISWHPVSE